MSYRRDMNMGNGRYSGEMSRGYDMGGSNQAPMNPWSEGSNMMNQSSSGNYNDSTTLLLANNLLNNLIRSSNKMLPSLLDVNPMPPMNAPARNMGYRNMDMDMDMNMDMSMRQGGGPKMYNRGNMAPQNRAVGNRDYGHFNRNRPHNRPGNNMPKKQSQFKKSPGINKNNKAGYANNRSKPGNTSAVKKPEVKVDKKAEVPETVEVAKLDSSSESSPKKNNIIKNEFDGINKRYFKCHVCKKNMWDGLSFKKHLKGHAHLMMMESLSDSYAIKGQLIRHEIRVAENKRQIETERKRRLGKGQQVNKQSPPVFCTMCDSQFTGTTLSLHRHSTGHLRLKKFLHPKCLHCHKEFATRIEWDEHLLSAVHKRKLHDLEVLEVCDESEELAEFTEQCEVAGINMKKLIKDNKSDKESELVETTEIKEGEKTETTEQTSKANTLTDYSESTDFTDVTMAQVPRYHPGIPVGQSFIEEQTCYRCSICHMYFASSEASTLHMKTLKHFDHYVTGLKRKILLPKSNLKGTDAVKAEEENVDEDEDNDSKRRKVDTTDENGQEDDTDMYDPSECTDLSAEINDEKMDEEKDSEVSVDDKKKDIENDNKPVEEEPVKKSEAISEKTEPESKKPEPEPKIPEPEVEKDDKPAPQIETPKAETPQKVETPVKAENGTKELSVSVADIAKNEPVKRPMNTPSRNVARGGPRSRRGTPRRY